MVPSKQAENEAFLRAERRKRILISVAVIVVAAVLIWAWMRDPPDPLNNSYAIQSCRADYQRARSDADTAIIDERMPISDPEAPTPKVSCRELRMSGRLAR
jgi:hypothetical protein